MASAGDVNGDGYGDVIVGGREVAQVFLGGAKGMAGAAAFTLAGAPGGDALLVQGAGDVNGDGAPDVFVGGVVYLGTGSGFVAQTNFTPGTFAADFVGDNDGDGLTDFAANQADAVPGRRPASTGTTTLFIQAGESVFATAGDIDGDGYWDRCRAQLGRGLPGTRARLLRFADRVRHQWLPRVLAPVHPRSRLHDRRARRARSSPRPATSTATAATISSC